MKVEKLAKNGEKGQNCYPLSPYQHCRTCRVPRGAGLASRVYQRGNGQVATDAWVRLGRAAGEEGGKIITTLGKNRDDEFS